MKPRVTLITLGVDDLERAIRFYRDGLGFHTEGIVGQEFEHGAVAFFDLQDGLRMALWPRTSIAHDTGLRATPPSATELTLAHNVSAKEEVDRVMERATAAGARIVKPAIETFWGGYAGYFQDPDGHLWEVAWNPQMLTPEATTETLTALLDAFNRHDLDAIMGFFAESCVLEMPRGASPWGTRYVGAAAVREGLATRFAGLPDVHYGDDRHFVSGNIGVSQWTLTGTARDGKKLEVRGLDVLDFREGKVVLKDSYWKIVE